MSSPAMLHNAAATISSLASLSLSGSPPPPGAPHAATSLISANGQTASGNVPKVETQDDDIIPEDTSVASAAKAELNSAGISVTKSGKKRGTIFKCESCSKVCVSLSLCDVPSIDTWPHRSTAIRPVSLSTVSPSSPLLASPPHRPISHSHRLGTFPALAGSF